MDKEVVVATECSECEIAFEINHLDKNGAFLGRQLMDKCPFCGCETQPLLESEYKEKYSDEEI